MTHEAVMRVYYTPDEMQEMSIKQLRTAYAKSILHMSDMQRKLVENMLSGTMTDNEAALKAGYVKMKKDSAGSRARKSKKVVHALHLGREIASRGSKVNGEWIRNQLRELLDKAKNDDDRQTITNVLKEFAKIDGLYATEQVKLLHANHEGGPLDREVQDDEWEMLSKLRHEIREDETETVH